MAQTHADVSPSQYSDLLQRHDPEAVRLSGNVIVCLPDPSTPKDECERLLSLLSNERLQLQTVRGLLSIMVGQDFQKVKGRRFASPKNVDYTGASHGGDMNLLPPHGPVIAKTSCIFRRKASNTAFEDEQVTSSGSMSRQ